ncbi:LysR family transcriptional regulator [Ottowia sp.]|uniref:LysR family transcriptional regulator n=1 Tax=Ottowia sp. TaxID=1898956 RepID=UPI002B885DBA|nr:LysR family transcriptional regulator [Ottowia sp.]HOB68103.1 LysR family transcriptional regulator [Ottowia sp.]HQD49434.1 LysR family transcriptional regulator [Ottowia sp.]
MELRHLRYFLALSDELHFGRAAQRLGLSQPPLTVAIQQLESEVGAPLFTRNSRGVRLTAAGQALVPAARSALERAQQALLAARDAANGQVGRLSIGFAGTMLYRGLPQILRHFQTEHARLAVTLRELSSSEQIVELQHARLDVGFAHVSQAPMGLCERLVSSQPFVACVPSGHALGRQRTLALRALADEPLALVSREVSPDYHARILNACQAAGFTPQPLHELRHWLSVVSLVAQGLAVALVPAALQQAGLAGAAFISVSDPHGALPRYETRCLWNPAHQQPGLPAFIQIVRGLHAA